jgi:hypothetical protein
MNEQVRELCRQAAVEKDPDKLLALVREINEAMARAEKQTPQPKGKAGVRVDASTSPSTNVRQ